MSKGLSGLFKGTKGERVAVGSVVLMAANERFVSNIGKRKDVDTDGYYDVIAHGSPDSIEIVSAGRSYEVSHRALARLLKNDEKYHGGAIRLLSSSTGSDAGQFAQNLANKLGVPVKAPTELLWAWPNGRYRVAKGLDGGTSNPDLTKPGRFKTFYPRKGKK